MKSQKSKLVVRGYKKRFYASYVSALNSHLYGEINVSDIERQYPAWKSQFGRFLPSNTGAFIVDLGCGNGGLVSWLHSQGFINAGGVDVSKEQIELGKRLRIRHLVCRDIFDFLKKQPESFDTIFIRDVLGHFSKPEVLEILELIYTSLRPGGRIVVKTPNAESPLSGRLRYGDFTHDVSFTSSSLRQVLKVCGFQKTKVFRVPPAVHGFVSFTRNILWVCIEFFIKLYRLIEAGSGEGIFTQNIIAVGEK